MIPSAFLSVLSLSASVRFLLPLPPSLLLFLSFSLLPFSSPSSPSFPSPVSVYSVSLEDLE